MKLSLEARAVAIVINVIVWLALLWGCERLLQHTMIHMMGFSLGQFHWRAECVARVCGVGHVAVSKTRVARSP